MREFHYDPLGRNTAEIWYDTDADAEMDVNRQNTLSFTYDALGRMLSAGDQFASYAYAYDRLGRMTSSDAAIAGLAPTVTLTNAYDAAGRRTQVAATIGGTPDFVTHYLYDQLGRTTSIRQSAAATGNLPVADKRVDFTYNLANQPVTLTRYADLAGNQLVAVTDYVFDQAGRLTGMTHSKGASIFADYDWMFDEANGMTRFESLIDGVADYTNDDTGQLTAAEYTAGAGLPTAPPEYTAGAGLPTAPPDEQYIYDENGNRINNGYTVGLNNQLLSDGTHTYTYDEEGSRTSRTHIATGEVTEYHWDHRNRLVRVTTRATANGPLTTDIHYAYDFGQRWVRKIFNPGQPDERSTIFVHDGGDQQNPLILQPTRPLQIVLHFGREGAGDAGETDLAHRYLWGSNVDQILADEQLDSSQPPAVSSLLWLLTDHLNTVRNLATYDPSTDKTTIVNHLTYDAFGNIVAQTDPTIGTLFHFTARPLDKNTGLQNNLNRWYDARAGRWISEDPVVFGIGESNAYSYTINRPISSWDSNGLASYNLQGQRSNRGSLTLLPTSRDNMADSSHVFWWDSLRDQPFMIQRVSTYAIFEVDLEDRIPLLPDRAFALMFEDFIEAWQFPNRNFFDPGHRRNLNRVTDEHRTSPYVLARWFEAEWGGQFSTSDGRLWLGSIEVCGWRYEQVTTFEMYNGRYREQQTIGELARGNTYVARPLFYSLLLSREMEYWVDNNTRPTRTPAPRLLYPDRGNTGVNRVPNRFPPDEYTAAWISTDEWVWEWRAGQRGPTVSYTTGYVPTEIGR